MSKFQPFRNPRVIVVRENWLGCTGLSAFDAFLRLGTSVSSLTESEYVPSNWRFFPMRVLGKLQRRWAVREFNKALLDEVERRCPDLVLVFKGTYIEAETIRSIRRLGAKAYCFYPDVSFRTHGPYLCDALPEYDWIFTTKTFGLLDMRAQLGITRASFLPHAFDIRVHRPRVPTASEAEMFNCDVSFIGTWSPKKEELLTELVVADPQLRVRVWGNQ